LGLGCLCGCELVPQKPEAVFVHYRETMKAGDIEKARALLSRESDELVRELASRHALQQSPENLALLNILDPVSPPLVMKQGTDYALLQIRTLKGGLRLVRVIRKDERAPWKIDISEELRALRLFLQARQALDMIREQAGEYAASWNAFNKQLERMNVTEPPPKPPPEKKPKKAKKKKTKKKRSKKKKKK